MRLALSFMMLLGASPATAGGGFADLLRMAGEERPPSPASVGEPIETGARVSRAAAAPDDKPTTGYGACRSWGNAHGVCLSAAGGYGACRSWGSGHGVCLSAASGYGDCRSWGNGHGVCLSAAGGYRDCRSWGNAYGVCLSAREGYGDCRSWGSAHGTCLQAR